jgi:hypothetical protein
MSGERHGIVIDLVTCVGIPAVAATCVALVGGDRAWVIGLSASLATVGLRIAYRIAQSERAIGATLREMRSAIDAKREPHPVLFIRWLEAACHLSFNEIAQRQFGTKKEVQDALMGLVRSRTGEKGATVIAMCGRKDANFAPIYYKACAATEGGPRGIRRLFVEREEGGLDSVERAGLAQHAGLSSKGCDVEARVTTWQERASLGGFPERLPLGFGFALFEPDRHRASDASTARAIIHWEEKDGGFIQLVGFELSAGAAIDVIRDKHSALWTQAKPAATWIELNPRIDSPAFAATHPPA